MLQRSEEWFAERRGKVTASRVADVVARTKSGYAASRENYMAELIVEHLTGQSAVGYTNAAMEWGTTQEPCARAAYSARTGLLVEEVGFVSHPTIDGSGASPDGVVLDGLVEIKCPNTSTHLDTLLSDRSVDSISERHLTQMHWQMACTSAAWCDYVSFDPRLSEHLQLVVIRVPRNDGRIRQLEDEVTRFLAEMHNKLEKLEKLQ